MASPSVTEIRKALTAELSMPPDALVVRCRLNFQQEVFLAFDTTRIALAASRPDGSVAFQQVTTQAILDVTPSGVAGDEIAFNLVLPDDLWRIDQIPEEHRSTLAGRLGEIVEKDLLALVGDRTGTEAPATSRPRQAEPGGPEPERGGSFSAPAEPESEAAEDPAEAEEAAPAGEEPESEDEDGTPWYASVQGPAIDTYFRESEGGKETDPSSEEGAEGAEACSGKEPTPLDTSQVQKPRPLAGGRRIEPASSARAQKAAEAETEPQPEPSEERAAAESGRSALEKTIDRWRSELAHHPESVRPYRELCRVFHQMEDIERAFWHAAVLTHFGVAEPVEIELYERYRRAAPMPIERPELQTEWFSAVVPLSQDPWPSAFFSNLARPVALHTGRSLRSYGLRKRDRCDLENEKLLVARTFSRVRTAMGYDQVELYVDKEADFELLVANVVERTRWSPVCVAGARALVDKTQQELTFQLARDLCFLRPEHLVCLLLPEISKQTFLMMAAMRLVRPSLVSSDDESVVSSYIEMLDKLLYDRERDAIEKLVEDMIQRAVAVDLEEWNRAVSTACDRAGLLFCQDLSAATLVAASSPPPVLGITPEERLKELLVFAVSPLHFEARRRLGIQIR